MAKKSSRSGKEVKTDTGLQEGGTASFEKAGGADISMLPEGKKAGAVHAAGRIHSPNYTDRSQNPRVDANKSLPIRSVPMAELIRKYRGSAGLSQQELGDMLGVTRNTVGNWEGGKYRPDLDLLIPMCSIFGISLYELLGAADMSPDFTVTNQEQILLEQYRQLSPVGQRVAARMVSSMLDEEVMANDRILDENSILLAHVSTAAAAGDGYAFSDIPVDNYCFVFKNGNNLHADAVMRVKGDSMLPVYRDGQHVYVQYTQSVEVGEDIICVSREGLHIKRLGVDGPYSLNRNLPFGLTSPDDHVEIRGRVLGIVSETDLPCRADLDSLEEIRHREIREFVKKHGLK